MNPSRPHAALVFSALLAAALLGACSNDAADTKAPAAFRFVTTYTEAELRTIVEEVAREFEKKTPGVKIDVVVYNGDEYHKVISRSLKSDTEAPGAFFQWCGEEPRLNLFQGAIVDLSAEFDKRGWKDRFTATALQAAQNDGRFTVVPTSIDVSNMIWFNPKLFAAHDVKAPTTWAEFVAACATFKQAGVTPIAHGNAGGWPLGNWAALLCARMAGEKVYDSTLRLEKGTSFAAEGFVKALNLLGELSKAGYFNADVNSIDEGRGTTLFTSGKAAMHPLGNWFLQEEKPEGFEYDFFLTPPLPDGKGDQSSFIGVVTGFSVGKNSGREAQAIAFLDYYSSPEVQRRFARVGNLAAVKDGYPDDLPAIVRKVGALLTEGRPSISPPDTGYPPAVAHPFYDAVKKVVGGNATPEAALKTLDEELVHLKAK